MRKRLLQPAGVKQRREESESGRVVCGREKVRGNKERQESVRVG